MKKETISIKTLKATVVLLALSFVLCFPQKILAQKLQFSVFGGMNHVFAYGSEQDYVFGENDFPVTPSHTPFNFGASLSVFVTDNIGVELDGRYTLSSQVTLTDPSDDDSVTVDTSKHYSFTVNFLFRILEGRVRPYFVLGGGIDKLLGEDRTYVTEYGWDVEFIAPEGTLDAAANVGGGVHYSLSSNFGIKFDLRYVLIFSEPDRLGSLNGVLGFSFLF
jgi:outer membrane protein W